MEDLVLLFFCIYVTCQLVFWSRFRMLFPSSNHEGEPCYLRVIRLKRRALGTQQIKVNSLGLKGTIDSIANCFSCRAGFCFSAA